MKPVRTLLCLGAAACLFPLATWANDIEPGKEYYSAIRTRVPIVLDGNVSEWERAPVLADPKFYVKIGAEGTPAGKGTGGVGAELVLFEEYAGGTWTGPDDHTSAVQIVYDDDNVYFGFVVTDDYHENSANSAWNGDSVQLMIADETRTTQVALYNYALGGVEDALGEVIVMHEAGPGGTEAMVTRNTETKRTIYEIKLPKEALGLDTLGGGVRFGLGMAINDGDEDTPGQKGWGGLGAHSIVFGKTPSETALITLARANDIEPGKEIYTANPAPNPIVLDGNLGEWTGIPVLSDPKFYVKIGAEGTPAGKGTGGVGAELVLFEEYAGGTWTGPDDHTSAVQIVYDQDNVYFGFVVTDEYHENFANSAWNGDSVQLMIADANQAAQIALYNYALGGVEDALGEVIVMHEAGPGGTEAVVARNTDTKRTTYEIKLPMASLGLDSLAYGTQFGLGMAINDGDEDTPGQKGWGGLGAHSIVFGKTPQETALITLGVGGTIADLLFLSAVNPTPKGFSFRANDKGGSIVNPDSARLIIDGEEVALTVSPKQLDATDFTYTRPTVFSSGSPHSYIIEVSDTEGRLVTEAGTFTFNFTLASSTPTAVTVLLTDNEYFTVNESAGITLELDGASVTPDSITRTATNQVTVLYSQAPTLFAPLSSHTLAVTFQTAAGDTLTDVAQFVAPDWVAVPAGLGTAPGTGADPGLKWRSHQLAEQVTTVTTSIDVAEEQLTGALGASVHEVNDYPAGVAWEGPQGGDGFFAMNYVNLNILAESAQIGQFTATATAPQNVADDYVPGVASIYMGTNNVAAEVLTFIEFPAAGVYQMGVTSDDGFRITTGNGDNPTYLELASFPGPRGAAETAFWFSIAKPGVYLLRLVWFQGDGGANVEWYTINEDGTRVLVNGTGTGALASYQRRTVPEPDLPATPVDVPMEVSFDSGTGEVVITWDAAVQSLQESGDLLNWSNVSGSSPFRATASGPAKYYRLLVGQ